MGSDYYQNEINRIERDIADLQKKIADETKKENDINRQIDTVKRSIKKYTSISSLQSKERQIIGYQRNISDCKKKISDYQKKIADKSKNLGKKKQELRIAETNEQQKFRQEQLNYQKKLTQEIEKQKSQLDFLINQNFSSNNNTSQIRESKEFDFFISHSTEDKDEIVRDIANALIEVGFKVWYDEFELKIGDSLRMKIDQGLSKSRYGIVIVSPSFVKKNWTEYELNGMVAREMNGHKVILPIWHKISKNEVLEFSPSLADKMALNTSIHTIKDIVKSLQEL